jgi:hypothetical protein
LLAWREQRLTLTVPVRSTPYLFPAITNDSGHEHLSSSNLARAIRAFADAIPVLVSEIPGPDGVPLPFDRRLASLEPSCPARRRFGGLLREA